MRIESEEQLRALYGYPKERPLKKVMSALDVHAHNYIAKSPFLVIGTYDQDGNMDASPKGGQPGFVKALNDHQLLIPEAKGNNRLDGLVNIVATGRIGILFLLPGMDETLRVNGGAFISSASKFLNEFADESKKPLTCLIVDIEEVFLHCAKALMRSQLWSMEGQIDRSEMPTMGQMLKDQIGSTEAPESQEAMVKRYLENL